MTKPRYGLLPRETMAQHDGIDILRGIIAGDFPHPPLCGALGFHLTDAGPGRTVFEGLPEFRHYNPIGSVHGGFAASLLDSALGCAVFSLLTKSEAWVTLDLKINYVRAITEETGPVRAEGRAIHRGRTIATAEGDLKDRGGKLYAHATTTCMIFPAKA